MSIVAQGVTKLYGEQKALDNVSFEVNTGEIVGFLGPNGAGKSTMMKIITGFIPASSGKVQVNGLEAGTDNKKIGSLSKGYRQRVGLAQALIHNPEVLILDEATSGLDPNQIVEIRNLIKEAGKEKTILLSTHIMQEVEAICNRVIIIDKGVIVIDEKKRDIYSIITRQQQIIHAESEKKP